MHIFHKIGFALFLFAAIPPRVQAYADPYYARGVAMRSGSEAVRILSAADFSLERAHHGDIDSTPYLCALQKLLPYERGPALRELLSLHVAPKIGMHPRDVSIALVRAQCPQAMKRYSSRAVRLKHLRVDRHGVVLTENPVWNACIRATPMSLSFLRSNTDTFLHRQRTVSVRIPYTCRDYHRGDPRVWTLPGGDLSSAVVLDSHGRLLGDAPVGYTLVYE